MKIVPFQIDSSKISKISNIRWHGADQFMRLQFQRQDSFGGIKWIESFHELMIRKGSSTILFLKSTSTMRSASFPRVVLLLGSVADSRLAALMHKKMKP
ncbi:hypothetical protein DVH24_004508 [Malus domestica]|uniref:Uncharacterized protein n=1 Tax=Malus domestica TaxID=3750 RepID=A0A498IEN0_MALDO|nr:hypothetical protein DVH24_004508 [Malus domestica]